MRRAVFSLKNSSSFWSISCNQLIQYQCITGAHLPSLSEEAPKLIGPDMQYYAVAGYLAVKVKTALGSE
jgi:hypothetical protein